MLVSSRFPATATPYRPLKSRPVLIRPVVIPVAIFIELMIAMLVTPADVSASAQHRENAMMRALVLSALLLGGASLAVAQNGPATDGQAPVAGGAAGNSVASGTAASIPARTARHHGTRHHRMYMMTVNRTHKGSKLTPDSNAKPLSEWLHRP
jgi:hypothetical protein